MSGKNALHGNFVTDISMFKYVTCVIADFSQGFQVTGIGQFINVNYAIPSIANNVSDR